MKPINLKVVEEKILKIGFTNLIQVLNLQLFMETVTEE